MGRLEKIVVLTVVFLIAVILGVSVFDSEGAVDPLTEGLHASVNPGNGLIPGGDPLAGHNLGGPAGTGEESGAESDPPAPEPDPDPAGRSSPEPVELPEDEGASEVGGEVAPTPGLLNTSVHRGGEEPGPGDPAPPERESLLVETEGLEAFPPDDQYMLYTWTEGDSFARLARRYYGSLMKVSVLRTANEDRVEHELRAGDRIMVPVFDPKWSGGVQRDGGAVLYSVQEGDSLWNISAKVYGSGVHHEKIFEANRDILDDPDDLALGMRLRIPRLSQ